MKINTKIIPIMDLAIGLELIILTTVIGLDSNLLSKRLNRQKINQSTKREVISPPKDQIEPYPTIHNIPYYFIKPVGYEERVFNI